MTMVGSSDNLNGEQDVTEFVCGETLYIRVKDLDPAQASGSTLLRQSTICVWLAP